MFTTQVGGRYRLEVWDPAAGKVQDSGWFTNLITDQGLDFMGNFGTADYLRYCFVGSGGASAGASDTALGNERGYAETHQETPYLNTEGERYVAVVMAYRLSGFSATLREVGTGRLDLTGQGKLFSRAVLPTPLTLGDGQELIVYYELRVYQPTTDVVTTVDGVTVTARAAQVDSLDQWPMGYDAPWVTHHMAFFGGSSIRQLQIYDGNIGPITGGPTDAGGDNDYAILDHADVLTDAAYVQGSFSRSTTLRVAPGQGNTTWKGASLTSYRAMTLGYGPNYYQFQFDPPLTKSPTRAVTIGLTYTWARRSL